MKKTLSINLNGVAFNIDEDAYTTLQSYLNDLGSHFSSSEESEILKDIEGRIAELFTEKLINGKTVIENHDVTEIIDILGHPDQFDNNDNEKIKNKKDEKKEQRKYRKLYRNPNDAILGGVASGCAAYLGWDVTLMRILFVIIVIVGFGWLIPIYFLLWLIVPEAQTAAQQLEMQGVEPNLENIKNYMESDKFKESAKRVGTRMGEVFLWLFKALFILIGGIIGFAFIMVAICIVAAIIAILVGGNTFFAEMLPHYMNTTTEIAFLCSLAGLFLCPAIGIIAGCLRLTSNKPNVTTPRRHWLGWILFIIWIISLLTIIIIPVNNFWPQSIKRQLQHSDILKEETRNVGQFSAIQLSGNITAYLTQSNNTEVNIRFPEGLENQVKTEVKNGELKIYVEGNKWITNEIFAYINTPNIKSIELYGASDLECTSNITAENLTLNLLGSSSADFNINVKKQLQLKTAGSSSVDLRGEAKSAEINILGASDLDAFDCTFSTCKLNATGASDAEITVTDSLWATATGTSEIDYAGSPKFVSQKTSGVSSITKQ
ncbi:MAG: DUF2807 domain-containing protein [Paludibacteraceae bacterium]|nr:DUF2807 domain-containing protein [Paludibacteraceae bacterium]